MRLGLMLRNTALLFFISNRINLKELNQWPQHVDDPFSPIYQTAICNRCVGGSNHPWMMADQPDQTKSLNMKPGSELLKFQDIHTNIK